MTGSSDQFEAALNKADANRLERDVLADRRSMERRQILEVWAESITNRLNPILDDANFGKGTTETLIDYDDDNLSARLTYSRTHRGVDLVIVTSAGLIHNGSALVGEDHREVENTARMSVGLYRRDTNEERSGEYRYSLQPASKVTSINQERFTEFLLGLVKEFGSS